MVVISVQRGVWNDNMTFPDVDAPVWTDADFI